MPIPLAVCTALIIDESVKIRDKYFQTFEKKAGEDVIDYNNRYRFWSTTGKDGKENLLAEAQRIGEFFPGRKQVRPGLNFVSRSRREKSVWCNKNHSRFDTHRPGIFTVQWVCKRPKLVGVSVMTEIEGISTALSVLLSRFEVLPGVCYYDDGCNMAQSIVLRVSWVNDSCIIACDRFHYKSHKRNAICDPESYHVAVTISLLVRNLSINSGNFPNPI